MESIYDIFGSKVFNDAVMRERLPNDTYKQLSKAVKEGLPLDLDIGNVVANAMKDWALENGATHFTHWFQPMTGITAEKHDSFISPVEGGGAITDFSGRELIKGEPDASSFPSGGLRATFEARGYTAWDPTSYAFIKDGSLCIPTVFCSYSGEVLDKKTPLIRSIEALNKQALRILRLFGNNTAKKVESTVGAEQEYFLIDKEVYNKRQDLIFCGRTIFGAKPAKGQELEDHYFGALRPRVSAFMKALDKELWKLGIPAKTKHNEVAPAQHEIAHVYTTTNMAVDQNQLTMETIRTIAENYGMVCLLHEKPFEGINGSGKHNNWSIQTDTGINLLDPGVSPQDNAQFLLFLCAVIKGVDEYADLLRVSIASAGNDRRLGAQEAPPSIVSIFVGDEMMEMLEAIEKGIVYNGREKINVEVGVNVFPNFPRDTTDRNRTSPFAFTGNKFEFRMVGSSQSVAGPNTILNTIVADELKGFADILEEEEDFTKALNKLLSDTIRKHKRVIFNGNSYSDEWTEEAQRRGLPNLRTFVDAIPCYIKKKNIDLFARQRILSEKEMLSRYEIQLESYCKTVRLEALTMLDMLRKDILPSIISYIKDVSETALKKREISSKLDISVETDMVERMTEVASKIYKGIEELDNCVCKAQETEDMLEKSRCYRDCVVGAMDKLRKEADFAEANIGRSYWPYPTYSDILFSV